MNFFSKKEFVGISLILLTIFGLTFYNLQISLRRSRDSQRKADLGAITNALNAYLTDFGFYPPAQDGKIVACLGEGEKLVQCSWGEDILQDVSDPDYPPYLSPIPRDPMWRNGRTYVYFSTGSNFQIYTSLEGAREDMNQDLIRSRGIDCGGSLCDYGKSSEVPLEKSLEEYENELREKM